MVWECPKDHFPPEILLRWSGALINNIWLWILPLKFIIIVKPESLPEVYPLMISNSVLEESFFLGVFELFLLYFVEIFPSFVHHSWDFHLLIRRCQTSSSLLCFVSSAPPVFVLRLLMLLVSFCLTAFLKPSSLLTSCFLFAVKACKMFVTKEMLLLSVSIGYTGESPGTPAVKK